MRLQALLSTLLTVTLLSACSSGWTEEERSAFRQSCTGAAQMASDAWPEQTCACLTEKLEKRYPNPNDMTELLDSLQKDPVLLFDKYPECRVMNFETPAEWNERSERAFINSCGTLVAQGQVKDTATCACVLDKVKRRFPTTQRMQRVNTEIMRSIAEECEGKRGARLY